MARIFAEERTSPGVEAVRSLSGEVFDFKHKLLQASQLGGQETKKISFVAEGGHISSVTITRFTHKPLHLDVEKIVRVELDHDVNSLPVALVTYVPTKEQEQALLELLQEYGMPMKVEESYA